MRLGKQAAPPSPAPRYPGVVTAIDGTTAVIEMEAAATAAARNARQIVYETEDAAAAAGVAIGLAMVGQRASTFARGRGIAAVHGSLAAAAGKRLPYVIHVACRASARPAASAHAGHDDYHAVDDTGVFQLFAKNVQEAADFTVLAHRIAELSLTPGIAAQDAGLTSDAIESVRLPEGELVQSFLGDPADLIESPTPAQRLVWGEQRRRIPEALDVDYPTALGALQDADAYEQGVAAQRPFFLEHVAPLADRAFAEYAALTGRRYARAAAHRLDDAEYVIVAQGSVVADAEALADHLRATRSLRIGVLNVTMFRPFPADLVTALLRGRRAVLVLERVDQPLAVDPPLLREIRAAMGQALENGRARGAVPGPDVATIRADQVPEFHAACFGLGGRDVQPADLQAAVENMLPDGAARRHVYLGIDFVRPSTRLPKLQIWQERLLESYPALGTLALPPTRSLSLRPPRAVSIRIHAAGDREASTLARTLALTAAPLLAMHVKTSAMSERRSTLDVVLAPEPVRANADAVEVDVVLAPDAGALLRDDALADVVDGGVVVVAAPAPDADLWTRLPRAVQKTIRRRTIRVFTLDGPATAFIGAFFRLAPLARPLDETTLVAHLGARLATAVAPGDDLEAARQAIERGYRSVAEVDVTTPALTDAAAATLPERPRILEGTTAHAGPGHPGRFWEQTGYLYATGDDTIADPHAALGLIPALTAAMRDATPARAAVPEFLAARCTGCGECWVQCPHSAMPGLVTPVDEILHAATRAVGDPGRSFDRFRQVVKPLAAETRRLIKESAFTTFADVLRVAYGRVAERLDYDTERRAALDAEFAAVHGAVADLPLARTKAFFDDPETRASGSGGLLSVTVNPEACTGCNVCVSVCPEAALTSVGQTDAIVARLRRAWRLWHELPDTDDRYVDGTRPDALPTLLLKKAAYLSVIGGDGGCTGCGEKTALHLVLAAVHATVLPRVKTFVERLDRLIEGLDEKARGILASDADLRHLAAAANGTIGVPLQDDKRRHVARITTVLERLRNLRWRYNAGPGGRGRACCAVVSANDGSSVATTIYPFNPYPVPWTSHPLAETPGVAVGIFEGQMRKMADGFAAVRAAERELAGDDETAAPEPLDWRAFTDDERALCPPVLVVGGDGESLSRLLASEAPLRIVVLDPLADADATRTDPALLALAHRNAFVVQSSPAAPAHLLGGVLRGLASPRPAVFVLHGPCPAAHGLADDAAPRVARLAVGSRAVPLLVYDPAAGPRLADRLALAGNPAVDQAASITTRVHVDDDGAERTLETPLSVADWAVTQGRFRAHFTPLPADADAVAFHEYLALAPDARDGKTPFVVTLTADRRLARVAVGAAIVRMAEDRAAVWTLLRDMAGLKPPDAIAVEAALRREYEAKLADLRTRYPRVIARRLAERLLASGNGTVDAVLGRPAGPAPPPTNGHAAAATASAVAVAPAPVAVEAAAPATSDEPITMDPWIDSALCTACNECTNLNKRMFAYNAKKQAYVKDPRAGTFKQLVQAAEKCPVHIIHPGTPLDPAEKDLDKWIARAKPFN